MTWRLIGVWLAIAAVGCDGTGGDDAVGGGVCGGEYEPGGIAWGLSGGWKTAPSSARYQGWAVVERSTEGDLVLVVDSAAGSGKVDSLAHAAISAARALPVVPLGSRVWLDVTTDQDFSGIPRRHAGRQLAVRDREGGQLLLAASSVPTELERPASNGVAFRAPVVTCSEPASCLKDGRETAYSLEVSVDPPQRLAAGEHADIALDGEPYELWLQSAKRTTGTVDDSCADYVYDDRLWLEADLRAREPEALISRLTQAELPACTQSNDPTPAIGHEVSGGDLPDRQATRVTYRGRERGYLVFERGDDNQTFGVIEPAPLPEPTVGQVYWLLANYFMYVLRETSASGPIVAASGTFATQADVADAAAVERFGQWLETPFTLEATCLYEPDARRTRGPVVPSHLFTAAIGGTAIGTGQHTQLALAGTTYDAWVTTSGGWVRVALGLAR
ncbi:MAG: hypothetical protein ABW321_16955 [Polyangiales bacterium]